MDVEENSNRSSFCLATPRCKRRNGTSDASRSSKKRSMIDLESQSQAMRLKKLGNSRLRAMLAIALSQLIQHRALFPRCRLLAWSHFGTSLAIDRFPNNYLRRPQATCS